MGEQSSIDITIREPFGIAWPMQLVRFPIDADVDPGESSVALVDRRGAVHMADVVRDASGVCLELPLSLGANETLHLESAPRTTTPRPALALQDDRSAVTNERLIVSLPRSGRYAAPKIPAPITVVTGTTGSLVAEGRLVGTIGTAEIEVTTLHCGANRISVRISYRFDDASHYSAIVELNSATAEIVVSEECHVSAPLSFELHFPRFARSKVVTAHMHNADASLGRPDLFNRIAFPPGRTDRTILLQPFYVWELNGSTGVSLHRTRPQETLTIVPVRAAVWRNGTAIRPAVRIGDRPILSAPIAIGTRAWALRYGPLGDCNRGCRPVGFHGEYGNETHRIDSEMTECDAIDEITAIHNGISLTKALGWARRWQPADFLPGPRLLAGEAEIATVRARVATDPELADLVRRFESGDSIRDDAGVFLATGRGARELAQKILGWAEDRIAMFVARGYPVPGMESIAFSRPLRDILVDLDLVVSTAEIAHDTRDRLLRSIAFLIECGFDDDFWPIHAGFVMGNINFQSDLNAARGIAAAFLAGHPMSEAWLSAAGEELVHELETSVYPNGAWIEAPNYQLYTIHYLILLGTALARAGVPHPLDTDSFYRSMRYLASLQTPVDPRCGFRMIAPLGDTTSNLWSQSWQVVFAWAAATTHETNEQFAREMMRAWIDGGSITCAWMRTGMLTYSLLLVRPELPASDSPTPGATHYEGFGVVSHSRNGSGDGFLALKGGEISDHYDHDEGSLIWYARGTPLLFDWGTQYNPNVDQSFLHNRVSIDHRSDASRGDVTQFASFARFDAVAFGVTISEIQRWPDLPDRRTEFNYRLLDPPERVSAHQWNRRVFWIRSFDALLVHDAVKGPLPAEVTYQIAAASEVVKHDRIEFKGLYGLDLTAFVASDGTAAQSIAVSGWEHAGLDERRLANTTGWRALDWIWGDRLCQMNESGRILRVGSAANASFGVLLVAHDPTEAPGEVSWFEQGRVARWERGPQGFYAVAGNVPMEFRADDLTWNGSAGLARWDERSMEVAIVEGSRVAFRGIELIDEGPSTVVVSSASVTIEMSGAPRSATVHLASRDQKLVVTHEGGTTRISHPLGAERSEEVR